MDQLNDNKLICHIIGLNPSDKQKLVSLTKKHKKYKDSAEWWPFTYPSTIIPAKPGPAGEQEVCRRADQCPVFWL